MNLLLFLSNDHRASSSTRRLSNYLLVPISVVQRNLYWTAFFRPRPIVHPNLIRLSKQCDEHCPRFWESSLHLMDSLQLPMQKVIEDIFFELEKSQLKQVLCGFVILDERQRMMTWRTRDSEVMKSHLRVLRHLLHLAFHKNMKTRLLYGVLHSLYNWFGLGGK